MNVKGSPVFYILLIFFMFSHKGISQVFDGSVYISTADSKIIRIDSVLTHPTETLVTYTSEGGFLDIGFAPDGTLYGVHGNFSGFLDEIWPGGPTNFSLELPYGGSNALTFDEFGVAYIGSTSSSEVLRVDVKTPGGPITSWHFFDAGVSSGDFVFLNHKLYMAWMWNEHVHLYEAILDSMNRYVSHRDLGVLPENTYGLTSNKENLIIGITESKQVYSFVPPASYISVIPVTNLYLVQGGTQAFGMTSKSEAFGNARLDFGDAPEPYPTVTPGRAGCHNIRPGICLGKRVDQELAGIPSLLADSDDHNAAVNDEDGITISTQSIQNYTFVKDCHANLSIEHTGNGYLSAWFDWNKDGAWTVDELIISGFYLKEGDYQCPVYVPDYALEGSTYCRFRFGSSYVPESYGFAGDGEVEDYMVNIVGKQTQDTLEITCGNSQACIGALLPVTVRSGNFNGIFSMKLTFAYDSQVLDYRGLNNINPAFKNQVVNTCNQDSGLVMVSWKSDDYISIDKLSSLFDLEFEAKKPGESGIHILSGIINSTAATCSSKNMPLADRLGRITIYNAPEVKTGSIVETCDRSDLVLNSVVTGDNPILVCRWVLPDGSVILGDSVIIHKVDLAKSGRYMVYCTDIIGCSDSAFTDVTVKQNPEISFSGHDTLNYVYGSVLDAAGIFDYCVWNTGELSQGIKITADGLYSVKAGLNGCEISDTVYMLEKDPVLSLPNAFTPNKNGFNDVLRVIGPTGNLRYFNMKVFSRWDNKIFESNNSSAGWDGTFENSLCPGGAYICIIKYIPGSSGKDAKMRTIQKNVILLR
ncbi:MAG: gliding motility-associated C-terminal domain-containing protein [Bacteroidota bacterium]